MATLKDSDFNKMLVISEIMRNIENEKIFTDDIARRFGNPKATLPRAFITEYSRRGYVKILTDTRLNKKYITVTDEGKKYFNEFLNSLDEKGIKYNY